MNQESFKTPVLFIVFNRPDTTSIVFEQIRQLRPERLFVAADGPRSGNQKDLINCSETRRIFETINWDCRIEKLFQPVNLGCMNAVSRAVDWFFEHVEEGIILEDDCLPDASFFDFCQQLLAYYRTDERIMHISGDNFQQGKKIGGGSYYFSKYSHIWGWATWRRAWQKYDGKLANFSDGFIGTRLREINPIKAEFRYWKKTLELFKNGKVDAWGSRWQFSVWYHNGLCILPNVNLVTNIGFGDQGTHTRDSRNKFACLPRQKISILTHPAKVELNLEADRFTYYHVFHVTTSRQLINFISGIIPGGIKKILKKQTSKIRIDVSLYTCIFM